jgi:hypothetical protein
MTWMTLSWNSSFKHHTAELENIAAVHGPTSEQRVHHLLHATRLDLAPTALLLDIKAPKKVGTQLDPAAFADGTVSPGNLELLGLIRRDQPQSDRGLASALVCEDDCSTQHARSASRYARTPPLVRGLHGRGHRVSPSNGYDEANMLWAKGSRPVDGCGSSKMSTDALDPGRRFLPQRSPRR